MLALKKETTMIKMVSEFCGTVIGLAVIAWLVKALFTAALGVMSILALVKFLAS